MKSKSAKNKGKIQLSRYFQELKKGDSVGIVIEQSINFSFPQRFQGRTGIIDGKRGRSYIVKVNDQKKEKLLLIEPIHLKKIKQIEKQ